MFKVEKIKKHWFLAITEKLYVDEFEIRISDNLFVGNFIV